ncbi:hypothetical protein Q9Q94_07645 [Uliginosibacterium sp. 31-16]|uniref:hypothetical protein n=1 Tax=Uliginosibacterium sp. 31-16 TaxID=3068315 RepID=UPI00273EEB29|nr:hypothetical protein [Uliginosibacterium sp. 31-16]MDP5239399.1 hypothetical protein [Uliginosibacterium sp. 31-16]
MRALKCSLLRLAAGFSLLAPLACSALAAPSAPTVLPIEAAGKLRSLAQRQAKLYLQLRLEVEPEASQRWLAESVRSFDENLALVARAAQGDAPTVRIVTRITTQWEGFRQTLSSPPDARKAQSVAADAEQIALAAQSLALRFDLAQDSPVFRLVDLASRNDMLAQRLARIYMQTRAGQGGKAAEVDMEQTRKEFAAGLKALSDAAENTPAIRANLELARQQWLFFDMAVNDRQKSFDFARRDVATTSERISQMMTAAAQVYGQMAGSSAEPAAPAAARKR